MNSWEIIKRHLCKEQPPRTLYYAVQCDKAAALLILLEHYLSDYESAKAAFNADPDVARAIALRPTIEELKEVGIIS